VNGTHKRSGSPITGAAARLKASTAPVFVEPERERRPDADALDLRIPPGLTVRRVAELIGPDTPVPVMEVISQDTPSEKWTIGRLADYFESPVRDTIYNCISCEVSNSPMGEMISRPKAVRETDLVDRVWRHAGPQHAKPTVGKYVLMSVKDSFTDFHVDFAGSSVFYHIYEGQKVFLAIPPTEKALKTYQSWSSSPAMDHTFLPDLIQDVPCTLITLNKGDTFFIPSGWIHAVYTPVDSLVIGGNFLTRNFYVNQMRIFNIEAITGVPQTMRYPRYTTLMWCTMFNYIEGERIPREVEKEVLTDVIGRKARLKPSKQIYSTEELKGLPSLIDFLYRNVMIIMGVITTSQRPGGPKLTKQQVDNVRKAVPWPISRDPLKYLKHFARWCLWKRACAEIVPGGEKLPDWAQVDWMPPGMTAPSNAEMNPEMPPPAIGNDDTPRRGGLRERTKSSASPDDILEDFSYFPERTITAVSGLNGSRRSSSVVPRASSRAGSVAPGKGAGTPAPVRKGKGRGRAMTPMPTLANKYKDQVEILKLTDGSLYVKKLSNLGPPRIGCESCRQKKTGCKHKEEIRARGWCDDDRATTQDFEPPSDKFEAGRFEEAAGEVAVEDTHSKSAPPQVPETPTKQPTSPKTTEAPVATPSLAAPTSLAAPKTPALNPKTPNKKIVPVPTPSSSSSTPMGPPAGYKGRKPSCEDCKALKVTPHLHFHIHSLLTIPHRKNAFTRTLGSWFKTSKWRRKPKRR
jgi:F-box/leucine-rich repeat protein 10/11